MALLFLSFVVREVGASYWALRRTAEIYSLAPSLDDAGSSETRAGEHTLHFHLYLCQRSTVRPQMTSNQLGGWTEANAENFPSFDSNARSDQGICSTAFLNSREDFLM